MQLLATETRHPKRNTGAAFFIERDLSLLASAKLTGYHHSREAYRHVLSTSLAVVFLAEVLFGGLLAFSQSPITYAGIRHFERTGHEPFEGLIPWLVDVAESRKLQLQWLPDQGMTCGDCEFAK